MNRRTSTRLTIDIGALVGRIVRFDDGGWYHARVTQVRGQRARVALFPAYGREPRARWLPLEELSDPLWN